MQLIVMLLSFFGLLISLVCSTMFKHWSELWLTCSPLGLRSYYCHCPSVCSRSCPVFWRVWWYWISAQWYGPGKFLRPNHPCLFPANSEQEIHAQLQSLYPDVKTEAAVPADNLKFKLRASAGGKNGLLCCPIAGWDWGEAYTDDIENGIKYLNGKGTIQIGPRSCSRISCSYNSAIFFCNDVSLL